MSILTLAVPAAQDMFFAAAGYGPDSDRFGATVAASFGLISVAVGGVALARATGRIGNSNGRGGAVAAVAVGMAGVILGVVHLANSTGGFGTGNGRAGVIVALVVGQIGINIGGLAIARSRRTDPAPTLLDATDGRR